MAAAQLPRIAVGRCESSTVQISVLDLSDSRKGSFSAEFEVTQHWKAYAGGVWLVLALKFFRLRALAMVGVLLA